MPRQASALERHRARALQFRKLGDEAEREKREKRAQLQHRIERKALEHRVLVEAIALEKELEARSVFLNKAPSRAVMVVLCTHLRRLYPMLSMQSLQTM